MQQTDPISLRPANRDDEEFLFELYHSTRREEIAKWGWTEAQQKAFVELQFRAQQQHYGTLSSDASHSIILFGKRPIGRLIVLRDEQSLQLADIVLLTEFRGRGIGRSLIEQLLDEAHSSAKPLLLHVGVDNPAKRLYERLGFSIVEDIGTHYRMQWVADSQSNQRP